MPNVLLCPVKIRKMTPTLLDELERFLKPAEMEQLRAMAGGRPIHVLGRTARDRKQWERLDPGTTVLFSSDGAVRRHGTVLLRTINAALARHKWGDEDDTDGELYDHIYLVALDGEIEIPYARLNEASGDSAKYVPFGLRIMDEQKSARVRALLREVAGTKA